MFERFTDQARKVMQFANQEAQRLSHEYIGTEHILLGIAKEVGCVAAKILSDLNVDLKAEVEKRCPAGPEIITMGKLPQTPRAKKVIEFAFEEARGLNHNWLGTEHLLLGLIREFEGVAGTILNEAGLTRETVLEVLTRVPLDDNKRVEPVPIGVKPRTLWLEQRVAYLARATHCYVDHGLCNDRCVRQWVQELGELLDELATADR